MLINEELVKYTKVYSCNGKQCKLETNEKTLKALVLKVLQNIVMKKAKCRRYSMLTFM